MLANMLMLGEPVRANKLCWVVLDHLLEIINDQPNMLAELGDQAAVMMVRHHQPAVLVKLIINQQRDPENMAKDAHRYCQAVSIMMVLAIFIAKPEKTSFQGQPALTRSKRGTSSTTNLRSRKIQQTD
uniref:Uncharacterized protein n=1 Tax=Timema poppense TaxID=170557 RepID=A0A7R9DJX0_TIMPO|nr:unnamed protein product [Timema poppensis]